jgi:antitoxin component YwqK of YwqJK toxin-antitoxin module
MYKLSISYDGKPVAVWTYSDAVEAVHNFDKCSDYGDAKEYATYNLSEPNGKMHTKNFHRNGKVSGK